MQGQHRYAGRGIPGLKRIERASAPTHPECTHRAMAEQSSPSAQDQRADCQRWRSARARRKKVKFAGRSASRLTK